MAPVAFLEEIPCGTIRFCCSEIASANASDIEVTPGAICFAVDSAAPVHLDEFGLTLSSHHASNFVDGDIFVYANLYQGGDERSPFV